MKAAAETANTLHKLEASYYFLSFSDNIVFHSFPNEDKWRSAVTLSVFSSRIESNAASNPSNGLNFDLQWRILMFLLQQVLYRCSRSRLFFEVANK